MNVLQSLTQLFRQVWQIIKQAASKSKLIEGTLFGGSEKIQGRMCNSAGCSLNSDKFAFLGNLRIRTCGKWQAHCKIHIKYDFSKICKIKRMF